MPYSPSTVQPARCYLTVDWYIYYRVRCELADKLQARALEMQSHLANDYDIKAALKRRPEAKDGRHTWMEIYYGVPDGFATILQHAIEQAELLDLIDGQRAVEYFLDVTSCA